MIREEEITYLEEYQRELKDVGNDLSKQARARLRKLKGDKQMKFYVAGKFQDRKNVRKLMDKIQDLGHAITYDWTIDEEGAEGYPILNTINDTRGVLICDVFVGRFIEENDYRGALCELGMAIIENKRILIIGNGANGCIFVHHPNCLRFESELECLSYIRQVLR